MILVLFFLFIIIFTYILILCSTLKIKIKDMNASNLNNEKKVKFKYEINLGLYLFNKVKYFGLNISNEKIKNSKVILKMQDKYKEKIKIDIPKKDISSILKNIKPNIEYFNLKLSFCTTDAVLTSLACGVLSSIIAIILSILVKKYDAKKHEFEVKPYYTNQYMLNFEFNCIIAIKMVHIIYVLYIFLRKEKGEEDERTSNRGSYDYRYE